MGAFFSDVWPFGDDKNQVLSIEPDSQASLLPTPTLFPSLFPDTATKTPPLLAPTSKPTPSPVPIAPQIATPAPTATVTPIPSPVLPDFQTATPPKLLPPKPKTIPDPYLAKRVSNATGEHYQVIDTNSDRAVLTTEAQFRTWNDVKFGQFNADFTQFAAIYHYGHEGSYSWIGIWSTEKGEYLYYVRRQGYTKSLEGGLQ